MNTTQPLAAVDDADFAHALKQLQQHGFRATLARQDVLKILLAAKQPVTVESVYRTVTAAGLTLSQASIYRVLAELDTCGIARRGWDGGEPGRRSYVRAPSVAPPACYRFVCRSCAGVFEIRDKFFSQQLYEHAQQAGFDQQLDRMDIQITCNACAGTSPV
ncbi:MAG: transcriptional repressor [Pseudomonadota bacterium]